MIGFIFTTKITKEKKNKIYHLGALRVLRGVIIFFFAANIIKSIDKHLIPVKKQTDLFCNTALNKYRF